MTNPGNALANLTSPADAVRSAKTAITNSLVMVFDRFCRAEFCCGSSVCQYQLLLLFHVVVFAVTVEAVMLHQFGHVSYGLGGSFDNTLLMGIAVDDAV